MPGIRRRGPPEHRRSPSRARAVRRPSAAPAPTASLTVTATAKTPAPAWSGSGAALTPVVPTITPSGDTVASVFAAYFQDPNVTVGIAVSGVTGTTNGTWQYSTDDGNTWNSLNSASAKQAFLLTGDDLIRFLSPKVNFVGTVLLTAHAWNGTGSGTMANLTAKNATGGTTAFSAGTLTASCLVNDSPSLTS